MRTLLFLVAGLLLLTACLLLGRLFSTNYPSASFVATCAFIFIWLVISVVNLWGGVSKAGYSVADELPIFLLIFGLPVVVAVLLKWRLL